jgi:hypothetical protein
MDKSGDKLDYAQLIVIYFEEFMRNLKIHFNVKFL